MWPCCNDIGGIDLLQKEAIDSKGFLLQMRIPAQYKD